MACGRIGESASNLLPPRRQNTGRSNRSAMTSVRSLSRRMKRPRSSDSTEMSASKPGVERTKPIGKPDHLRRMRGHHRHNVFQRNAERQHRTHRLRQGETCLTVERMVLVVVVLCRRAAGGRHFGVVAVHVGAERGAG